MKTEDIIRFDVTAIYNNDVIRVVSEWCETSNYIRTSFIVRVNGIKKDISYLRKLPPDLEFK